MKYYSQIQQDKYFIENFMEKSDSNYFVDVGCHDGVTMSNTLTLENLGWNGLLIEVEDELFEKAKKQRKNKVVNECVFSVNDLEKTIEIPLNEEIQEGNSLLIRIKDINSCQSSFQNQFKNTKEFTKKTKTLTKIFEENNVPSIIGYMSIDIEGSDYDALLGLDFNKYIINFLTIEWGNDKSYFERIKEFLESKKYKLHRINNWDAEFIYESS